jgi:23S rRNA (adenine2030-N6)-methyltransferase
MLAYRHAFHAGNHGDVLKHLTLALALDHQQQKDKGLLLVDTHAGAGGYALSSAMARKKDESAGGIACLWQLPEAEQAALPAPLRRYLELVAAHNGAGRERLARYPGSPALLNQLQRAQDRLHLCELHPADFRQLQRRFARKPGVELHPADGFAALGPLLPPPTRRALVLIDPPYELERDYTLVHATLRNALSRFAEGVFIVWIPQIARLAAQQLPKRLQALAPKGWLHARLTVTRADARGIGLTGSSVFVFNPPYILAAELRTSLPVLARLLGDFDGAGWALDGHQP